MKKRIVLFIALLTVSLFVFAEVKIGVINAQKVIQETKKGREITQRLERLGQEKQQRVESLRTRIKQLEQELVSPALNAATREKKTGELTGKRTELKRFIEDAQREMQQKSQAELSKLREEIMPLIEKIGKEKGFTVVMDLSISGIAYFDKTIDITDLIIAEYDKAYSGK